MGRIPLLILCTALSNFLFGCFTFPSPTINTPAINVPPVQDNYFLTPLPDVKEMKCPVNSGATFCLDEANKDNLLQRLTILHDEAMQCHS